MHLNRGNDTRTRHRRSHVLHGMVVPRNASVAGLLVLVASIASLTLAQQTPPPSAELIARGVTSYASNYCGACHALQPAGTNGTFGPSHDDMAATALQRLADPLYSGSATTPEEYLRESILEPSQYLVPGFVMTPHAMPSFAHLPAEDIDALIALLLAQ